MAFWLIGLVCSTPCNPAPETAGIKEVNGNGRTAGGPHPHWKQHARRDAQRKKMEPDPNCARHMLLSVQCVQPCCYNRICVASRVASSVRKSADQMLEGCDQGLHLHLGTEFWIRAHFREIPEVKRSDLDAAPCLCFSG